MRVNQKTASRFLTSSPRFRDKKVSLKAENQPTAWSCVDTSTGIEVDIRALFLEIFPLPAGPYRLTLNGIGMLLMAFLVLLMLLSLVISILRYRLWDIDVVIRLTFVYSGLTLTLLSIFFGVVVILQAVFVEFSGQQSPITVVISTLVIAAFFNHLRKTIQSDIDQRFFCARTMQNKPGLASFPNCVIGLITKYQSSNSWKLLKIQCSPICYLFG